MKHINLVSAILIYGGCNSLQTDYRWIRAHNQKIVVSAKTLVEDKGNMQEDLKVLATMDDVYLQFTNLIDSLQILSKETILERTSVLIGGMDLESSLIRDFFNVTTTSSDEDFQLQLALLESELLHYYQSRIGLIEVAFDRLELIFIPKEIGPRRIKGEIIFVAISANVEKFGKMHINNQEIAIKDGRGIVDLSPSELEDGKVRTKIVIEDSQFQIEQELDLLNGVRQSSER